MRLAREATCRDQPRRGLRAGRRAPRALRARRERAADPPGRPRHRPRPRRARSRRAPSLTSSPGSSGTMAAPVATSGDRIGFEASGCCPGPFLCPDAEGGESCTRLHPYSPWRTTRSPEPSSGSYSRTQVSRSSRTPVTASRRSSSRESTDRTSSCSTSDCLVSTASRRRRQILAERSVPIVAVTGRSTRLVEQALGAGAASYLLKPFATDQLVEAVNDALAIHRRRTERMLRAESLRSLESLVRLVGYPAEWAAELESRAWDSGRVWREVD